MSFVDAIKTCYRKYVAFSGRASRSEYWWFVLFLLLGSTMSAMIDRAIYGDELIERYVIDELTYATIETTGPFASIFWLLAVLPFLAAGWRRMHDTGRSGLFLLAPFVVILGVGIFDLFLAVTHDNAGWANDGSIVIPILIAGLVAFLLSILWVLWLLTRASQLGTNNHGPAPQEVLQ